MPAPTLVLSLPVITKGATPPEIDKCMLPVVWPLSVQTINVSPVSAETIISHTSGQNVPDTTAPGATQFDVAPVNAKLVSKPSVWFELESVSVVTELLLDAAIPWLK